MGLFNAGLPNTTGGGDKTKSIQRGVTTVGVTQTLAVSISKVNTAKTVCNCLGGYSAGGTLNYMALTAPETLSITNGDSSSATVSWEIQEFY